MVESYAEVECPKCGYTFEVKLFDIGQVETCPKCRHEFALYNGWKR